MSAAPRRKSVVAAALLGAATLGAAGCGMMDHPHHAHGSHADHQTLSADPGIPGESIYQLDNVWQTSAGEELRLADLRGNAVVGAMVYASCEYACPLILADMKRIEAALPESALESTRFVLFSFDPERDSPETLAAYREQKALLGRHWVTLRAPDATVRELAVVLGVRYKKAGEDFAHSNLVVVLDRQGVPRLRQEGLNNPPDSAVATIRGILGGAN